MGASRRFLGALLADEASSAERDLPTAVVSVLSAQAGAWGVRVHDVRGTRRARLGGVAEWTTWHKCAMATDRITLTGVRVRAHHGVFEFEREQGQEFVIDVSVAVDLAAAASGDDLARTVHYGELAEAVVEAVRRDPVDLIETVAERVAGVALGWAPSARWRSRCTSPRHPSRCPSRMSR